MKILILGGTRFVGRHITDAALARGHTVTLFNRGRTNADLFSDVETLYGDRDGGLDVLCGRRWDAVIDVNGYLPRLVRASAELLKNEVERYVFISTISVFADFTTPGQTENAPLATLDDPNTETITGETYGGLKALCEQVVQQIFNGRALIIRPGYVVGPYDHTDRWTAWMRRVARGGEMLAPGEPSDPTQFIDARDLAAFTCNLVEQKATGIYNVTGPAQRLTWGELFDEAKRVSGSDVRFTWVNREFLEAHGVDYDELPLVLPKEYLGGMMLDVTKAISAGLRFRPLERTIRDTLAWDAAENMPRLGLSLEREAELLREWHVGRVSQSVKPDRS
ncbi:MAG TPA: SDR family oxidoreductase [Anaerolineae bacterium]|nr:SDR family oxidoreductase [Anaerolineae bacterium]